VVVGWSLGRSVGGLAILDMFLVYGPGLFDGIEWVHERMRGGFSSHIWDQTVSL
jgi:hypothetical protein